jgi:hypothetical protein
MILRALRRAAGTRRGVFVIALAIFTTGGLGAAGFTSAYFNVGFDTKTATFAGGYVAVPTIAAVYPSTATTTIGGYDGGLVWTNGTDETTTNNEIQQIFGADQGATSNCTGASYSTTVASSITSPTTTTTFTYTDSNRGSGSINGDWYCYEVVHGWPNSVTPAWTAAATTNVQIGLVPISVVVNGGGSGNGKMDNGDTIVITYNQPVTMSSGTGTNKPFCTFQTEGVALIGDTTCGPASTATGDSYTVGKISMTISNGGEHKKANSTIGVSGNQVTITLTQNGPNSVSGTPSFVSSSSGGTVLSAATTDQATACTSGPNCTLNASGNF